MNPKLLSRPDSLKEIMCPLVLTLMTEFNTIDKDSSAK